MQSKGVCVAQTKADGWRVACWGRCRWKHLVRQQGRVQEESLWHKPTKNDASLGPLCKHNTLPSFLMLPQTHFSNNIAQPIRRAQAFLAKPSLGPQTAAAAATTFRPSFGCDTPHHAPQKRSARYNTVLIQDSRTVATHGPRPARQSCCARFESCRGTGLPDAYI
jgi:hypothetical protein